MKPEKVVESHQHLRAVVEHQQALNTLREEDPGIPPGSEHLSPAERYDIMANFVKISLSTGGDHVWDEEGQLVIGSTPAVPIEITKDGQTHFYFLMFEIEENTKHSEDTLKAIWMESLNSNTPEGGYNRELSTDEPVSWADITEGDNDHYQRMLNDVEWSFNSFRDTVIKLPPDYAAELGFQPEFVKAMGFSRRP